MSNNQEKIIPEKEKMTDRDREFFIKGVHVGISSCVNQLSQLEKSIAVQIAMQNKTNQENEKVTANE